MPLCEVMFCFPYRLISVYHTQYLMWYIWHLGAQIYLVSMQNDEPLQFIDNYYGFGVISAA